MNNRKYTIFSTSELSKIDFSEVFETSVDTVRKSVDGTKTFVKWSPFVSENGEEQGPLCLDSLTTIEGTYTHSEILDILAGSEWSSTEELF